MSISTSIYNLSMTGLVTLWIIDFSDLIAGDINGSLYLSSYKNGNNLITFNGNSYSYVGVSGSGFVSEINGQLPQPSISIDRIALNNLPAYQTIKASFISQTGQVFFDWRGARVTRIRTTTDNLNSPARADSSTFLVDQVLRTTKESVDLRLTVSVASDKINGQSVQELAPNRCSLRYRSWNGSSFTYTNESAGGCPYGNPTSVNDWSAVPGFGTNYFTNTDQSTTQANLDSCSYSVAGCQARFDPNKVGLRLPFTGLYKPVNQDPGSQPGN